MTISRRSFMKAGIMGTVFAGISLEFTTGAPARLGSAKQSACISDIRILDENRQDIFNHCTKASFSQYLHTKFLIYRETGETEEVTLVKVSDLGAHSDERSARRSQAESFSLIFRGSASNPLVQDTYTIKHEDLGVFNLFLVAVGLPKRTQNYQVIFNR